MLEFPRQDRVRSAQRRSARRRVVHVTLGLDVGGQEKLLVEFARHADRNRFELHFLALGQRGRLAHAIEGMGWPVTAMQLPQGLRPEFVLRLARWFRRQRCDVVHTHDDKPLLYGALAARMARVPRILHTHHHGCLPQTSRRQARMVQWAARLADVLVCVSNECARYLVQTGIPAERLRTLHNGIDLDRFSFRGPSPSGPAVTVARLSPEKDIATLLRAAALVSQSFPDFRLVIAGDGPCRTELAKLTASWELNDKVQFLGETSDIPALLKGARIFVLSSLTEGISLTILEAMASGLPVIATQVGGNPEVVVDQVTGLLVPPADPAALARAIMQVWDKSPERTRLGCAGRQRAESHFDVRRMVASYENFYVEPSMADGAVSNPELGLQEALASM